MKGKTYTTTSVNGFNEYYIDDLSVTKEEYEKEFKEFEERWAKSLAESQEVLASQLQIGGNHYKDFIIQPAEFCYVNSIPYLEATAIKYLCRWKKKGGVQDLEKAKHFIDLLIEYENANPNRA